MIIEKVNQMASQYCEMKPDRVRPTRGENRFWRRDQLISERKMNFGVPKNEPNF